MNRHTPEPRSWASLTNRQFLTETKDYVTRAIATAVREWPPYIFRLSPTELLQRTQRPRPIAASDLKVDSSWEPETEDGCHFKKCAVDAVGQAWLKEALDRLFAHYTTPVVSKQLFTFIGLCMGEIMSNVAMLLGPLDNMGIPQSQCTITSESELRFAIADPIMKMICMCWGYQAKLEETVKGSSAQSGASVEPGASGEPVTLPLLKRAKLCWTPGTTTNKSVSENSRSDFSIYTITDSHAAVVAVLITAKMTTHSQGDHALGQLLGYYIKFLTDGAQPPLCAVLSERGVQLVCFPYWTTSEAWSRRMTLAPSNLSKDPVVPAVDALVLLELPLLEESSGYPNRHLLSLILVLCAQQHSQLYGSTDMDVIVLPCATKKAALKAHIQSHREKLEAELHETKDELQRTQEELQGMKEELQGTEETLQGMLKEQLKKLVSSLLQKN